jgi:hypothetical protein
LSAFDFRQRFTASFLYELPFGQGRKPDAVSGAKANLAAGQQTIARFFNTDAYVDRVGVAPGATPPVFRYGTAGRNTVIGPGITSLDVSLNKFFRFREHHTIEFRGEFFNLPNTPIFGQPGTTLRTATYGVISATRIDSRQIQLALKYSF